MTLRARSWVCLLALALGTNALGEEAESEGDQRLAAVSALFDNKDYEAAALAAQEIAEQPGNPDLTSGAQLLLGKSLYRMGLYHSALSEFSKLLAQGPQSKRFNKALEWLVFISHQTVNTSVVMDDVARYPGASFPDRFRYELYYLLARYHAAAGRASDLAGQRSEGDKSFAEVKRLAQLMPKDEAFYAPAKYLEGLALFREDRLTDAVQSMKEVVRHTRPSGDKSKGQAARDLQLRDLAFMQLGRTHYGKHQFKYADAYFKKVSRGGDQWLESLFEDAWATYRMNEDEQALGNLVTLSAPSFRNEYYPEAYLLQAVVYYQNCRFDEARARVEDFEKIYVPVFERLSALVKASGDATSYYGLLEETQSKKGAAANDGTDAIMQRVLRLALSNKDLKGLNDSILELEAEIDNIGKTGENFRYSGQAKTMIDALSTQRTALIQKAGVLAKSKLEFETEELAKLVQNGLRIKFEITSSEKGKLEAKLGPAGKARDEKVVQYDFAMEVGEDQLYWPLKDEYWRDELGTYLYTLTHGCAERRAAGSVPGEGD
jgi:tetratricopeptide (TPR) repeat protein